MASIKKRISNMRSYYLARLREYSKVNPNMSIEDIKNYLQIPEERLVEKAGTTYEKFFELLKTPKREVKRWTKETIIESLNIALDKGFLKQSSTFLKNKDLPNRKTICKYLEVKNNWNEIAKAIGRDECIKVIEFSKEEIKEAYLSLFSKEKKYISLKKFERKTGITFHYIRYYFKSWNNFLDEIGLEKVKNPFLKNEYTDEEIIMIYKEISEECGKLNGATYKEINESKKITKNLVASRFGNIQNLREVAGYDVSISKNIIFHKDKVEKVILKILKKKKKNSLTPSEYEELRKDYNLPSVTTLKRMYRVTEFKKIWKILQDIEEK